MRMFQMTDQERDVQRKLKVLRHAEQTGNIAKTCRYFGKVEPVSIGGKQSISNVAKLGSSMRNRSQRTRPIRLRQRSWRKSFICEPNTTLDQSALFGI